MLQLIESGWQPSSLLQSKTVMSYISLARSWEQMQLTGNYVEIFKYYCNEPFMNDNLFRIRQRQISCLAVPCCSYL